LGLAFQERKRFFFEKKKQKTFIPLAHAWGTGYLQTGSEWIKVLAVLDLGVDKNQDK
jgi:hypothetical protein